MTMDTGTAGEWLSLKAAAQRLHLSEKTLRRRVKAAVVEARQVATQHGQAWEVWVDDGIPESSRVDGQGSQPVHGPELLEALHLVERQQQTIMELAGRVGFLQSELGQARDRILALEAPKPEPVTVEPTPVVEATPAPATRRWWRRWFA